MNPFDMLKNAQALQAQMNQLKNELAQISATGSAGGNMVQVSMNGHFEVTAIKIDPVAVDPRDVPMLQDLLVAACHDALAKVQDLMKEKAGPMLGGMNLPGMDL
jgi:nucleoid-associated protein EbfC